jgi:hypothetical protein
MEAFAAYAQRVVDTLVGPGAIAVERDREVVHAELLHEQP